MCPKALRTRIDEVWAAITNSRMLTLSLMENDFEPPVGARYF
jgi:hypothetical protein